MNGSWKISGITAALATLTGAGIIAGCNGGSSTAPPPPLISVSISPSGAQTIDQGQSKNFTATPSNDSSNKGVNWTLTQNGVACSPACGSISPASTASGVATTYTAPAMVNANLQFNITATSVADSTKSASDSATAVPPPVMNNPAKLPSATVGQPYSFQLTETGGVPPFTWSIVAGALPAGLTLNSSTGLISGTPTGAVAGQTKAMAAASSSATTASFTVQAQDSGTPPLKSQQQLSVDVIPPPDFSISASPASQTINRGGVMFVANYTVTLTALNGFSAAVVLSASGLPPGVTASFDPTPVIGSGTSIMQLKANSSTASLGTFTITITGAAGLTTHTTTVGLTVVSQPDFSLDTSPSLASIFPDLGVAPGNSNFFTVLVTSLNGFTGTVDLSVSFSPPPLPSGVTATFNPTSVVLDANHLTNTSTVTLAASSTASLGEFNIAILGVSGSITRGLGFHFSVTDFAVSANPNSLTIPAGGTSTSTVTVSAATAGPGGVDIGLSDSVPPGSGVMATLNSPGVIGSGTSWALTVTASSTASPGTFPIPITITATMGTASHTATVNVTITPPPPPPPLSGQYMFLFNGFDSGGSVVVGGTFTVDAKGNVTGGVEDINRSSGVTLNQAITGGSVSVPDPINNPNRGTLTLATSLGMTTYKFTVESPPASPSGHQRGNLIEFDDMNGTGTRGSAFFERQDPAPLSITSLNGDNLIGLSGFFPAGFFSVTSPSRVAAIGRFTIDPATCTAASTTCMVSSPVNHESQMDATRSDGTSGQMPLTGSFDAPDPQTGRGMAHLHTGGSVIPPTLEFIYYLGAHSTSQAVAILVPLDVRNATVPVPTLSGQVRIQVGPGCMVVPPATSCTPPPFDNTALNANLVFATEGVAAAGSSAGKPSVAVGLMNGIPKSMSTTDGTLKGTLDQNEGGTLTDKAPFDTTSTYTVEPDGRTTINFTVTGTITKKQVAYLSGVGSFPSGFHGFIMDISPTGSDVHFGELSLQPIFGGFGPASLKGAFRVSSASPATSASNNESGIANFDGVGTNASSFSLDADLSNASGLHANQISSGTYDVTSNGRGTQPAPAQGAPTLVFWIGEGVWSISTDSNPVLLHFLQLQ